MKTKKTKIELWRFSTRFFSKKPVFFGLIFPPWEDGPTTHMHHTFPVIACCLASCRTRRQSSGRRIALHCMPAAAAGNSAHRRIINS